MACNIDLFTQPELLDGVQDMVKSLSVQIRILDAFESAKRQLHTPKLQQNVSVKCLAFIHQVDNETDQSPFCQELSNLNMEELLFSSISFPGRLLDVVKESFKARYVRAYMASQQVNLGTHRRRMLQWFKRNGRSGGHIEQLLGSLTTTETPPLPPPPQTKAEEADCTFAFDSATTLSVAAAFGRDVADSLPQQQQQDITESVRWRIPRSITDGDGLITLQIATEKPWLHNLFPGHGLGANVQAFEQYFGPEVIDAIDGSELRQWEKRSGLHEWTNCVKLTYVVKLRVRYESRLLLDLYSQ